MSRRPWVIEADAMDYDQVDGAGEQPVARLSLSYEILVTQWSTDVPMHIDVDELEATAATISNVPDCADVVQERWPHGWKDVPLPYPRGQLRRHWRLVGNVMATTEMAGTAAPGGHPGRPGRSGRALNVDWSKRKVVTWTRRPQDEGTSPIIRYELQYRQEASAETRRTRRPRSSRSRPSGTTRPLSPRAAAGHLPTTTTACLAVRMVRIPRARRQRHRRRRVFGPQAVSGNSINGPGRRTCRC